MGSKQNEREVVLNGFKIHTNGLEVLFTQNFTQNYNKTQFNIFFLSLRFINLYIKHMTLNERLNESIIR